MVTPVIHAKTEPLRELVAQFDKAPAFAKLPYARELMDRMLTVLAVQCHEFDRLTLRLERLERFPEVRSTDHAQG